MYIFKWPPTKEFPSPPKKVVRQRLQSGSYFGGEKTSKASHYGSVLAVYPDMFFRPICFFGTLYERDLEYIYPYIIYFYPTIQFQASQSSKTRDHSCESWKWRLTSRERNLPKPAPENTDFNSAILHRSPFFCAFVRVRCRCVAFVRAFVAFVDVSAHEAKTGWPKTQDSMCKPWTLGMMVVVESPCRSIRKKKSKRAERMETVIK